MSHKLVLRVTTTTARQSNFERQFFRLITSLVSPGAKISASPFFFACLLKLSTNARAALNLNVSKVDFFRSRRATDHFFHHSGDIYFHGVSSCTSSLALSHTPARARTHARTHAQTNAVHEE